MPTLTREQKLDILEKAIAARERGNHEDAAHWSRKIPLAPHLAVALKQILGIDELLKAGYNLSEAEKSYGQNWLHT